jgi:protoporphyrinogen oxidase
MEKISIAVIGGGITGITAAIELAKTGRFEVTLYEKKQQLGGLSDYYEWDGVRWDRFYHVILSADANLLEFLHDLNLSHRIKWRETRTGFFGQGRLVSLSSSIDFLRFPFLSLFQKLRLGLGILYSASIKDPAKLDRIYVKHWLTRIFGRRVYENIWDPLLRSKFGDARNRTSAALIWASICRLFGARSSGAQKEKMGYVEGGYRTILEAIEICLNQLQVKVFKGSEVKKILNLNASSELSKTKVITSVGANLYDQILLTTPCPVILNTLKSYDINCHPYYKTLEKIEYLGVICVLLILKKKLSPYYVINLLDQDLPFTGVIEVTNVVNPSEVGNHHLVYLPKYLNWDNPLIHLSDGEIVELFKSKLKKMFRNFGESDVVHTEVFRERYVQPLQELNVLKRDLGFKTPIDNIYIVNSSMIYNSTLNNNAAITLAKKAANKIYEDCFYESY